jgi:hypothetical protein
MNEAGKSCGPISEWKRKSANSHVLKLQRESRFLRICRGLRLDQQALSLVTATSPAEAHDDRMPAAFRFGASREQGIACRQIFEKTQIAVWLQR